MKKLLLFFIVLTGVLFTITIPKTYAYLSDTEESVAFIVDVIFDGDETYKAYILFPEEIETNIIEYTYMVGQWDTYFNFMPTETHIGSLINLYGDIFYLDSRSYILSYNEYQQIINYWTNKVSTTLYQQGFTAGKAIGYNQGYAVGYDIGYQAGYLYAVAEIDDLLLAEGLEQYNLGLAQGYLNGYDAGILDGLSTTDLQEAYNSGYNKGFSDGNTSRFYDGLEKWLVPAIIVVIFMGGFVTIVAKKRESE